MCVWYNIKTGYNKKENTMFVMDADARKANRERQKKYREEHRNEINEKRREKYNDRISAGKCPRCGGKVKKGYTLCENCCDYQADLNKKYAKQRKKAAPKARAASKATPAAPKKTGAASKTAPKKARAAPKPKTTGMTGPKKTVKPKAKK
jgi:hypothetical protein